MAASTSVSRRVRAVSIVLALAPLPAAYPSTAYGPWRSTELGGGGYILNVHQAPSAPDTFYTHIDVGGVYRSDDGARTWRMLHDAFPAEGGGYDVAGLSVDPRDADTVLAAVGSEWFPPRGLYRSADGGRSWKNVLVAQFFGNGPFRDAGQVLARSPADPDLLLAASTGGVFRSTDAGLTWSPVGLPDLNPVHVQFSPRDPRRVWLCALHWAIPRTKQLFAGGFHRSDDAGLTWQKLSDESPSEIAVRADADEILGLFKNHEVRRSRDGGATWETFQDGLDYGTPKNPSWHDTHDRSNTLVAGLGFWLTASRRGAFYRRAFDAPAWEKLPAPTLVENAYGRPWWGRSTVKQRQHFGAALGAITLDSRDPARRWFFTDWFGLWRSDDAGATWTLSLDGIEPTCLHALEPDPAVPGRVHLGYWDLGYVVSDDAGSTAHRERSGQVTANFKAIAPSPASPGLLLAAGDGRVPGWFATAVWRSRDSGSTWEKLPAPGLPPVETKPGARFNSLVAHPREPQTFYLAASGPIGLSAAASGGGLYVTRDAGDTWAPLAPGLAAAGEPFFRTEIAHHGPEIAVQADGALLAISVDHHRAARLLPGDAAWTPLSLPAPGQPRAVVADPRAPGRFFLSLAEGGLWRSDDSGASWRRLLAEPTGRVALDPHVAGRVAVGTLASVWVSEDGGDTWRDLGEGLPHRWYPVPAFSRDRLLVGTIGSGVFWRDLPRSEP